MKRFFVRLLCVFFPSRKLRHRIYNHFFPLPSFADAINKGRHTFIGGNFFYNGHSDTSIGAFSSIAVNVSIGTTQHPKDWLSTSAFQYLPEGRITPTQPILLFNDIAKPVHIGNDVWIGRNVIVQDGINIGDGAIIGSGAIVTHDIPPYAIAVGIPARVIKYRFSEDIISDLIKLKWWNLPDEEIIKLPFNDINACIKELKKIRKRIPTE